MRKQVLILLLIAFSVTELFARPEKERPEKLVTFRFVPGQDMFYVPWSGNAVELNRLYALVDEYRDEITTGQMPVYVDGYSATMKDAKRNLELAFIRANRVKSELITHKGLLEEHFVTKNYTIAYTAPDGETYKDMVVVTLRIPVRAVHTAPEPVEAETQVQHEREEPPAEPTKPESAPQETPLAVYPAPSAAYPRWSIGASVGVPFFWGDMTSSTSDKTYIGISAGLQATYRVNSLLGVGLSLDWARNKAGSRSYATDYLLDAEGMTWYTPQSVTTQAYGDLYTQINMFAAGLHLDVNAFRLFGSRLANRRFKVIVSPAVYAQHFSSKVYTKADDKVFAGNSLSKDLSLGLGGDVALRYSVSPAIDLQLKGTGIWITDNLFDNIRTVGHVQHNAMWGVSAGVVWKIVR